MMSPPKQISSLRRPRLILAAGIVCLGWLASVADVTARTVGTDSSIRSLNTSPIAPRGGVLLLPLSRDDDRSPWPERLSVTLADGSVVEGSVGLIHASPQRGALTATALWTSDPRRMAIRPPGPGDQSVQAGSAVLLARLPEDATGPITLGRQALEPIWRDRPLSAASSSEGGKTMPRVPALDRPDPDSPFEHWRWVLLAERLDHHPPSAETFDPLGAMLAESFTDLWHIGLARLAVESPGLAQHVCELLTRICTDGDVAFAAWVADPAQTGALLNHLLNMRRTGRALVSDVLKWTEEQDRVRFWIESDAGDVVRLALVNPGARPALVRFDWSDTGEPPLAVEVEPGAMRRVSVDRPAIEHLTHRRPLEQIMAGADRQPKPDVLAVTSEGRTVTLPLRPRVAPVSPPGFWLPALRPALTLAEVQGVQMMPAISEYATTAHVRRLRGRWEVFVESRRPSAERQERGDGPRVLTTIDEARGREAVILSIGDGGDDPRTVLIIPEEGWHHVVRGSADGSLRIHRHSDDDRWVCRIVLPDSWLGLLPGQQTHVAVMRTRSGKAGIEYSPVPPTPWRTHGSAVALDLASWVDLP